MKQGIFDLDLQTFLIMHPSPTFHSHLGSPESYLPLYLKSCLYLSDKQFSEISDEYILRNYLEGERYLQSIVHFGEKTLILQRIDSEKVYFLSNYS